MSTIGADADNAGSVSRNVLLWVAVGFAVIGGFVAVEVSGFADRLGALSWFSNGANVIQWVSGPATFGAIIAFGYRYFVRRCAVPLCIRAGEHPVEGTLKNVCTHHHTTHDHRLVQRIYTDAHRLSGKLGWDESPATPAHPPLVVKGDMAARAGD